MQLEKVQYTAKAHRRVRANNLGEHAIVIGGSITGLMAAKVLADFFDRVTVLERDQLAG